MIALPTTGVPTPDWTRENHIVLLGLAHAFGTLNFMAVLAMAPAVQASLSLSRTEFGLLTTAYYGGLLGGALPFGWIVDKIGVRWALVTSHLIMAVATALLAQTRGLSLALACVGLGGLGYAFVSPATAKGVLLWFPVHERGTAMGIKQTGVPIGGAAAAGLGALGAGLGWRAILWMVAGLTAGGAGLYLFLSGSSGKRTADSTPHAIRDFLRVLRNRDLRILSVTSSIFGATQQTFSSYLTLFIRDATQAGLPFASLCLGLAQAGSAVGRISWGLISDRLLSGRRKIGMVLIGASASVLLMAMPAVGSGRGLVLAVILALLLGLTIASYAGLSQTAAVEVAETQHAGAAVGYNVIFTSVGAMLGPPLFGGVVDRTGRYSSGWLLFAASC